MAETVRIEIPVSVKDNTSAGVQSATRNMSNFERSMKRTEQQLNRLDRAHHVRVDADDQASGTINRLSSATESLDGTAADVEISANDTASQIVDQVEDQVSALDGSAADVDVGANDTATQVVNAASDAVENFDGQSGDAELGADDGATPVIRAAEDAVENFDGSSGDAEIGADDGATPVVRAAQDAVENFDGMSGDAEIGADDQASPVIDSARDKAESWAGSVFNATIGIIDNVTAPIQSVLRAVSNPVVQGASLLGVSLGVADTVNTFKDFESMMSQVKAISGATGQDFEDLTAKAKEMGATTKFTATQSAEAFNYMAMAGWQPTQMIDGISGVMNLAAASGEDLGTTSDIVTDAITAFGLQAGDAGHFADVLAQASANANTNVGMLGESFKYVAPVAGAMNYTVEDTSLALGLMANASVKGSMAGTSLKTAIANMAAPTSSMAAAMEKYGISITDSEGNMKSLKGVMDNIRSSLGGLAEDEQTAAASTIFGKEAMAGMLAIVNASEDDYNKLSTAIYNSKDAAQDMADTMMDNLAGSMTLMQSAVEGVQNSFGKRLSPYLKTAVEGITAEMPAVEEALNNIMDVVDGKATSLKRSIKSMTGSQEWKDADFFGKVDIAWDKIIAEPFMSWAGSEGKSMLSQGIGKLFSSASAILPGGEKAGLISWLSAGLIGVGASKLISGGKNVASALVPIGSAIKSIASAASEADTVGGFFTSLTGMTSKAGMIGLGAAAIAAAIAGIAVAVDNYNSKVLNDNLEEHFGKIKLSAKEAEEIASGILNQKYLTNVELALNEVKNADSLREAAQKALESNDVLEFKSRVGITLTPEEREDYTSNIKTFVDSKIEELQSRTFAAHIHVQTYIGGTKEGDTLAKNIEDWARADNLELTNLSNDLQTAVEKALTDGIIDVDEEQAISALQEKMNNITARWKESEAQAKWDWINQEYGNLNAADLESGSFTDLLEAMRGQRQSAKESVQADVEQWYSELNSMESAGRITAAQNKQYKEMTGWYVKGQEGSELTKSLQLGANTLNSAYAEKIQSNRQSLAENAQYSLESAQNMLASGDTFSASNALMYGFNELGNGKTLGFTTDATQNALSTMYESMKPDVTQMQGLIDDYREVGKAVPQSLMDSFNEAIEVGAAAGDTAATWQNYANQIWQNGSDELKASLTDPSNPMYETIRSQLPPELTEAIDRAAAETTTEDVTLEGLKASVDGDVDIDKDKWVSALNEKLGDLATTEEVTAEGATIKVEAGDCLWDIGNALGVDWRTIAEENGIESPYVIHPGDEIKISMDTLTAEVDGDAAQSAIDQAMSALTTEGAEFSVTAEGVQVDLSDVQVDSESAAAQIEAALGMESGTLAANGIEVETGATVTVPSELVQVDASGLQGATQEAVNQTDTEPVEKDTSANVNVTDTTTNAEDVQGKVEEDLQGAVGDASVEGSANVTFSDVTADTSGVLEQVTAELESAVSSVPANGHAEITLDQTNNSSEIYSLATGDVESAFSQTIPTDGHVDVTLDQTNNADAIYSECAGQVQSTFSRGFSASADVAVTLNWHITNPSASISTSSSGSSVSATIAGHANGGEVGLSGAELSWVGEEGLEYIIPTVPGRRQRGISLWMQAGKTLGMLGPDGEISAHANGGAVGAGSSIIPEDSIQLAQVPEKADNTVWSIMGQAVSNESSKDASEGDGTTFTINNAQQNDGGGKVEVNVNMNPVIKIEGSNMDEEKIFQVLQNRIREMADDLGDEIAERMGKIFNNMPAVQEA